MSETEDLENEMRMAEEKANAEAEASLVRVSDMETSEAKADDEYLGELKMQAQEYGQKIQDAADKARVYANEKFAQAGDKFNELKDKDPREILEDAKDYAREKPGQTILISAAVGLVLGLIFGRSRK